MLDRLCERSYCPRPTFPGEGLLSDNQRFIEQVALALGCSDPTTSIDMAKPSKPTKAQITKYRKLLSNNLGILSGDVGSMKDEALRASEQDASVDHLADQGTDNYDQGFLLGLIENEELTIQLIEDAIARCDGEGDLPFGACVRCHDIAKSTPKGQKKPLPWIPKERLEYIPWARYCVAHQEEAERDRESA